MALSETQTNTRSLADLPARWAETALAERTAIVDGEARVTYRDLDERATEVQRALEAIGVGPGHRVAVVAEKSIPVITAFLGTLACGASYIPLDPRTPPARAAAALESADAKLVLAPPSSGELARALVERVGSAVQAGELTDDGCRLVGAAPGPPSPGSVGALDEAYVFFTSGSTGLPKGVSLSHANALAFVDWAVDYFRLAADSVVGGYTSPAFDLSVFDLYATFAAGATLHLVRYGAGGTRRPTLWPFLVDHGISHWLSVPGVLALIARDRRVAATHAPALRELIWCGDAAPAPVVAALMAKLPHVRFTNLYGPTETTTASTYYSLVDIPDGPVPIGRPLPGEEVVVIDQDGHEAAAHKRGEICIGGVGVSRGYVGPQADNGAFSTWERGGRLVRFYRTGDVGWKDGDGLVHFLGRQDAQTKVGGYRVELGDVEASLLRVDGVRQAAVVALPGVSPQGDVLCAAVVVDDDSAMTVDTARAGLSELVPPYMVPTRWAVLDDLPRTSRGKVDRPALRARFEEGEG